MKRDHAGKPPIYAERMKQRAVDLTGWHMEQAAIVGSGSAAAGIRKLIELHSKRQDASVCPVCGTAVMIEPHIITISHPIKNGCPFSVSMWKKSDLIRCREIMAEL